MYTSMWFMSIVAILVVDVRTGALLQEDVGPQQCYQCHNESACQPDRWLQAPCPVRGQHCATIAVAPGFTSTLTCAASGPHPCALLRTHQTLQLTCTCSGHRCNAPFTAQLRNKLVNFSSNINTFNHTSLDFTEMFLKSLGNVSFTKLYDMITVKPIPAKPNNTQSLAQITSTLKTSVASHLNDINAPPRAEALKHEATEPSDDEEDESEGSGSYEESRLRRPAAAPAAPSSYLPASDNTAPTLFSNFILLSTLLFVTLYTV